MFVRLPVNCGVWVDGMKFEASPAPERDVEPVSKQHLSRLGAFKLCDRLFLRHYSSVILVLLEPRTPDEKKSPRAPCGSDVPTFLSQGMPTITPSLC